MTPMKGNKGGENTMIVAVFHYTFELNALTCLRLDLLGSFIASRGESFSLQRIRGCSFKVHPRGRFKPMEAISSAIISEGTDKTLASVADVASSGGSVRLRMISVIASLALVHACTRKNQRHLWRTNFSIASMFEARRPPVTTPISIRSSYM